MDLATAKNHRSRLQNELDALRNHKTVPSNAEKFLAMEVDRLNQQIASAESLKSIADGSEVKIAVENDMMMLQLSTEFGLALTDIASLEILGTQLLSELAVIKKVHQPLPLTYQLTQRVMELLGEQISRQGQNASSENPSPRSRFYYEELNKSIIDAINTVIVRNQEGATSYEVLDILRENKSIVIDDYVKRTTSQRFFEATFSLNSKPAPAPAEYLQCCSFLELINPFHWFSR